MRTRIFILTLAAMFCRLSVFAQANMSSGFPGGGAAGGGVSSNQVAVQVSAAIAADTTHLLASSVGGNPVGTNENFDGTVFLQYGSEPFFSGASGTVSPNASRYNLAYDASGELVLTTSNNNRNALSIVNNGIAAYPAITIRDGATNEHAAFFIDPPQRDVGFEASDFWPIPQANSGNAPYGFIWYLTGRLPNWFGGYGTNQAIILEVDSNANFYVRSEDSGGKRGPAQVSIMNSNQATIFGGIDGNGLARTNLAIFWKTQRIYGGSNAFFFDAANGVGSIGTNNNEGGTWNVLGSIWAGSDNEGFRQGDLATLGFAFGTEHGNNKLMRLIQSNYGAMDLVMTNDGVNKRFAFQEKDFGYQIPLWIPLATGGWVGMSNATVSATLDAAVAVNAAEMTVTNSLTVGGTITGNGSGITNLSSTAIAHTQTPTNFISGYVYTNATGGFIQVKADAASTAAASVGTTGFYLYYDPLGGKNWQTNCDGTEGTVALTVPGMVSHNYMAGWITNNGTYSFTNVSTAGSATLNNGYIYQ